MKLPFNLPPVARLLGDARKLGPRYYAGGAVALRQPLGDLYEELGVARDATREQIAAAYRAQLSDLEDRAHPSDQDQRDQDQRKREQGEQRGAPRRDIERDR